MKCLAGLVLGLGGWPSGFFWPMQNGHSTKDVCVDEDLEILNGGCLPDLFYLWGRVRREEKLGFLLLGKYTATADHE